MNSAAFLRRTAPSGDCLVWTGATGRDGYGLVRTSEGRTTAHRMAWLLFVGPVPDGIVVRHKCDNPACVHLNHLELGTQADNIRDRDERGHTARGEAHGMSRLSPEDVRTIRALSAAGNTQHGIAAALGISRGAVCSVLLRKTWDWL